VRLWPRPRPILRYDRSVPAAYPNGRTLTDDVYSMRHAWLTYGRVGPDGLKPHDDLLNEFPYLGLPNPVAQGRSFSAPAGKSADDPVGGGEVGEVAVDGDDVWAVHAGARAGGIIDSVYSRRCLTMEYLVSMTTHVPDGTPEEAIQDIRAREAAHSSELAAQGHLLRLWRPPLQPGEWRTLGLFVAADGDRLEEVLAPMPLRVWRTDEVTPLSPHPNDPPSTPTSSAVTAMEFLVTFTLAVPPGTAAQTVEDTNAREAHAAHDLAGQGHLLRLWTLPDGRALGLYQARDAAQMQAILEGLPLAPWMTMDTTPLSPHPSDPAIMFLRTPVIQ
jgi:muconolactone delta-isomerase